MSNDDKNATFNNSGWKFKNSGNVEVNQAQEIQINKGSPKNVRSSLAEVFADLQAKVQQLPEHERKTLLSLLGDIEQSAIEINEGNEEKLTFFEQRLKSLYSMRNDIGEVAIASLASPALGIALTLRKIVLKVRGDLKLGEAEN